MTQVPAGATIPIWPFRNAAEANDWRVHNPPADQAWHLDPAQTALRFARDYLGFVEVDRVTSSAVDGTSASIGVGSLAEGPSPLTVAVVRLIRAGSSALDPWQVVGAQGVDLSITLPVAGTGVTGPLAVTGLITGVDEALHVQVRAVGTDLALGEVRGIGAGGQGSPWSASVGYSGPASGVVLTVVVSTGGHLQRVERFTVVAAVQA